MLSVDDIPLDVALRVADDSPACILPCSAGCPRGMNEADGFQYIEMRDGTKLSVMVRFPDPNMYGDGPWPTVVEYSGYSTSKPSGPEPGSLIANLPRLRHRRREHARAPAAPAGVFDVFNPAQHSDGYDVIETVGPSGLGQGRAAWAWSGCRTPGIAQLYVAATRPPSLAAITPLSTIADAWEMQWPGGIYNSGFTRQWLEARDEQASARRHGLGDHADRVRRHPVRGQPRAAGRRTSTSSLFLHGMGVPARQRGWSQPSRAGAADRGARLSHRCVPGRADRGHCSPTCSTTTTPRR